MMNLNYQMVFILFQIISNISLKHKTLITIPLIYAYVNRIDNRLVFKIKDQYKLELQTHVN